jgi:hypothetical protein
MNFIKKAGKSVAKAAKSVASGVELELLKTRKNKVTRKQSKLAVKYEEYKRRECHVDKINTLIKRNEEVKAEYVKKLLDEPVENTVFRDLFEQIIGSLTTANEVLCHSLKDFQTTAGVIVVRKTTVVKKKEANAEGDASDNHGDDGYDDDISDLEDDFDNLSKTNENGDIVETESTYTTVNKEYYDKETLVYEKKLEVINARLAELRSKNK